MQWYDLQAVRHLSASTSGPMLSTLRLLRPACPHLQLRAFQRLMQARYRELKWVSVHAPNPPFVASLPVYMQMARSLVMYDLMTCHLLCGMESYSATTVH